MDLRLLLPLGCLLLAGCAAEREIEAATVEYTGQEPGEETERADCDADGTLVGAGRVEDGTLRVTVMDGAGNAVFTKTYQDEIDLEGENLAGADGTWTVQAERDAFDGQYSFTLTC